MVASGFQQQPKSCLFAGMPPIFPASVVRVISSSTPSSAATEDTASGIPTPKLQTSPLRISIAALLAMTLRALSISFSTLSSGTLSSPLNDGL